MVRLKPLIEIGDSDRLAATTYVRHGGYELSAVTCVMDALGVQLVSVYIGHEVLGYRATHLLLMRGRRQFLETTSLDAGPSLWWTRALLDHLGVLQEQLAELSGDVALVHIDRSSLSAIA